MANAQSLEPIGGLSETFIESSVFGISGDGRTVVGSSESDRSLEEAFRWTANDGVVGLGGLPGGGFRSVAFAVSEDGEIIVGGARTANGARAFRWTETGGLVDLGVLPGRASSVARGISSDGNVIVGGSSSIGGSEAFRWTQEDGLEGLGDLPGGNFFSFASAVSADGQVIAGRSVSAAGTEAFRWTRQSGMESIGDLPGGAVTASPNSISSDGSTIVGSSFTDRGREAFRWTQDTGMVGLGFLPEASFFSSTANDVSADGRIVVGSSSVEFGGEAFIWTEEEGMLRLSDVLVSRGVDLEGLTLGTASAISDDGTVIAGGMRDDSFQTFQGFVAVVPELGGGALIVPDQFASSFEVLSDAANSTSRTSAQLTDQLSFGLTGWFDQTPVTQIAASGSSLPISLENNTRGFVLGQGVRSFNSEHSGASGAFGLLHSLPELDLTLGFSVNGHHGHFESEASRSEARASIVGPSVFARFAPESVGPRLIASANASFAKQSSKRRYLNGTSLETATGDTQGYSVGGDIELGWRFAFGVDVSLTPYFGYQAQYTSLAEFAESGATLAGSISSQHAYFGKAKVGARGHWQVSKQTALFGSLGIAHIQEQTSNPVLEVPILGAGPFDLGEADRSYGLADMWFGASHEVSDSATVFGGVRVSRSLGRANDALDTATVSIGAAVDLY